MGVCYEMRRSQLQRSWCTQLVESFLLIVPPAQPQVRFRGSPVPSLCRCWCWQLSSCQVSGRDRSEPSSPWSRTLIAHSTVQAPAAPGRAYMDCQGCTHSTEWLTPGSAHAESQPCEMKSWQFFFPSCPLQICVWCKTHTKVMCELIADTAIPHSFWCRCIYWWCVWWSPLSSGHLRYMEWYVRNIELFKLRNWHYLT